MSETEELNKQITELTGVLHKQYDALTQQRAVLDYLLDAMEKLAIEHDLEEEIDAIMVRITGGEPKEEEVSPQIILS